MSPSPVMMVVIYPSYFKLHVRWLSSLTPVTYLCTLLRFAALPPSCSSNYLGICIKCPCISLYIHLAGG
ncbi:hypothetical protein FDX14_05160 [Citrobacter sp. wls710]|nr:hypothetical protein FOB24_00820 [Citrobacter werkmanii]TKU71672.1 hypothetical protein FDW92_20965 [Citrobacter sp. wls706]TKU76436.1 hypothetical protein FDX14_05160 [Citrobacter sp. wls710]TKU82943.1 hypothetical protein FDW97_14595 [Citrobacter sp. wls708]